MCVCMCVPLSWNKLRINLASIKLDPMVSLLNVLHFHPYFLYSEEREAPYASFRFQILSGYQFHGKNNLFCWSHHKSFNFRAIRGFRDLQTTSLDKWENWFQRSCIIHPKSSSMLTLTRAQQLWFQSGFCPHLPLRCSCQGHWSPPCY